MTTRTSRQCSSISPPPKRCKLLVNKTSDKTPCQTIIISPLLQTRPSATDSASVEMLRIYSWNINGISSLLQSSLTTHFKLPSKPVSSTASVLVTSLRQFLRRNNWPQVVHLQEVKINPSDEITQRAVRKAVNPSMATDHDGGPTYTVEFCLPTDNFNARGFGRKVNGVASIIRDDFYEQHVARIRPVDWDLEGRVLVIETKSKLALFNIYAVNGTTNEYRDSVTGAPNGTRHDRKLEFHRLLAEEGRRLEQSGFRFIMSGDFNVAPAPIDGFPKLRNFPEQHVRNRADFNRTILSAPKFDELGLDAVDSFRFLHPNVKAYSWVSRNKTWLASCDRVDLILVSRSLVENGVAALKYAGILMTEADRGPSDHCPIYVAIESHS